MDDFFEIDFLDVESNKSGDAIAMRYAINGQTFIHVTDGGFLDTGSKLVAHIKKHYDNPTHIDYVVATHPDGDHTAGLREVLKSFSVGELWMHRPWLYAHILIERFPKFSNVENLKSRLKEVYPNIAALEEIALNHPITIREPFQGERIGAFIVMAPTLGRYLDLVVESEKTPESFPTASPRAAVGLASLLDQMAKNATRFVKSIWGSESLSPEATSPENEMSVVQYATLKGKKILLTGDTGRSGLAEVVNFAPFVGLTLPGIDKFQVPHHGSRRNVSSELLDLLLGPRLRQPLLAGNETFTAVISSAKADKDHPRNSVVRAMIHRGGKVVSTEGKSVQTQSGAPHRVGWSSIEPMRYPEDQED